MFKYYCSDCGKLFERKAKFYGDEFVCRSCGIKRFWSNENNRKSAVEKRKSTNLSKYGFEHAAMHPDVKKKQKESCEKSGYVNYFQRPGIMKDLQAKAHSEEATEKKKETNRKRFGTDWPAQNEKVKEKMQETLFERTGYKNAMQDPKTSHSTKSYIYEGINFDSSWELAFYIYLRDNKKSFIYHPDLYMKYIDEEGIERTYKPDFLVEGKFFEIKGDQFFDKDGNPYDSYNKKPWKCKYDKLIENNVNILRVGDIKKYLRYVKENYGKNYLKQFKTKRGSETRSRIQADSK